MAKRIQTTGISPRHEGDTAATALNEVVLALAAEIDEGVTIYQMHLALGNSHLPPAGLGMTLIDQVKAGKLETDPGAKRPSKYRITRTGQAWLTARGVSSKGMADTISRGEAHAKMKLNSGMPDDVPVPRMLSGSGVAGTTREWLGLPMEIAGHGQWAWANLDTAAAHASPRIYRSTSPMPERPGNEMTGKLERALKKGRSIPPMPRSKAARLREACSVISVNAIRRAMERDTITQKTVLNALTLQARKTNPKYPKTRFGEILRGRLLPDEDEASMIAAILGIEIAHVAPHLIVAKWLVVNRLLREDSKSTPTPTSLEGMA